MPQDLRGPHLAACSLSGTSPKDMKDKNSSRAHGIVPIWNPVVLATILTVAHVGVGKVRGQGWVPW